MRRSEIIERKSLSSDLVNHSSCHLFSCLAKYDISEENDEDIAGLPDQQITS